jgi:hypothetical protein
MTEAQCWAEGKEGHKFKKDNLLKVEDIAIRGHFLCASLKSGSGAFILREG